MKYPKNYEDKNEPQLSSIFKNLLVVLNEVIEKSKQSRHSKALAAYGRQRSCTSYRYDEEL